MRKSNSMGRFTTHSANGGFAVDGNDAYWFRANIASNGWCLLASKIPDQHSTFISAESLTETSWCASNQRPQILWPAIIDIERYIILMAVQTTYSLRRRSNGCFQFRCEQMLKIVCLYLPYMWNAKGHYIVIDYIVVEEPDRQRNNWFH